MPAGAGCLVAVRFAFAPDGNWKMEIGKWKSALVVTTQVSALCAPIPKKLA